MADSKISALPASTTPLTGTEVLPIVQSSTTKQISVANLTAGRAISATQLTLTTGNVIVANGQGVDFSATPGTGTSELFADYEEGTWTPTITFGGLAVGVTYATQTGFYVKVGSMVHVSGRIDLSSKGVSVGDAYINGLPFSALTNGAGSVGFQLSLGPSNKQIMLTVSTTSLIVRYADTTSTSISQASDFANNSICIFSATYRV